MAELATIARPYAEALFQAVGVEATSASGWLDELATVAASEELRRFADSPKATPEQVFGLIAGVLTVKLPTLAENFLRTVIDNGRLAALPEIAQQFRDLKNAKLGAFDAIVYSAFELDGSALADLSGVLEQRFARMIGGIRVVVGDEVLDASVQARLQQMKVALTA